MRLFTGLSLPPDISDQTIALSRELRTLAETAHLKLSWTAAEKLHITTKFIGEFPDERLSELCEALSTVALPNPIDIRIGGLGWMPNASHPSALYAAVESTDFLLALASATDAAVEPLGIERENRTYCPHVTLARVRDRARVAHRDFQSAIATNEPNGMECFRATSFFLYLSSSGKYTKLKGFTFLRG